MPFDATVLTLIFLTTTVVAIWIAASFYRENDRLRADNQRLQSDLNLAAKNDHRDALGRFARG